MRRRTEDERCFLPLLFFPSVHANVLSLQQMYCMNERHIQVAILLLLLHTKTKMNENKNVHPATVLALASTGDCSIRQWQYNEQTTHTGDDKAGQVQHHSSSHGVV